MNRLLITNALLLTCFFLLLSSSPFAAESTKPLATQLEKESYSIGYQIGLSMKGDKIEVDVDRLIQGMQAAIGGKDPLLGEEEMKDLIVKRRKLAREQKLRQIQEEIVANAKESQQFLNENKGKEGVHITASGLQYKVLRDGDGPVPQPLDFVTVDYRGTFIDGKEFDSSFAKGKPIRVQADGVIKGWTEALTMMKSGAKWQLFVPPELAYGRSGMPGRIPPNKVLIFDMELLSVEQGEQAAAAPESASMTSSGQPTSQPAAVRNMTIVGQIAKSPNGYIIRGVKPAEIFTILNGDPQQLDPLAASEQMVSINVRVVSGDNVEIETINGGTN